MIHNLLGLIWAFIILAHDTKYKILILRVDEIMLALFLAALESNEDKQVFIKIYEQHLPLMERTATRILKEQSDSEDAVQNAFVQIIRHFDKIHKIPREELPFWIISIVKNEALSIIRKRQKTVSLENWDGYIIEASNPVPTPLLGHRCRSSQEITGSPTPFSTSNHYLWICPRASFSLSNPNIAA